MTGLLFTLHFTYSAQATPSFEHQKKLSGTLSSDWQTGQGWKDDAVVLFEAGPENAAHRRSEAEGCL